MFFYHRPVINFQDCYNPRFCLISATITSIDAVPLIFMNFKAPEFFPFPYKNSLTAKFARGTLKVSSSLFLQYHRPLN